MILGSIEIKGTFVSNGLKKSTLFFSEHALDIYDIFQKKRAERPAAISKVVKERWLNFLNQI